RSRPWRLAFTSRAPVRFAPAKCDSRRSSPESSAPARERPRRSFTSSTAGSVLVSGCPRLFSSFPREMTHHPHGPGKPAEPQAVQAELDDLLHELGIGDADLGGGLRDLVVAREARIRIDLDHVDLVRGRDPQVDPGAALELERPKDGSADAGDLLFQAVRQV